MSELNQLTDHALDAILNLARIGEYVSTEPVRGTEAELTEDSNQRFPEPIRRHVSEDPLVNVKVDLMDGEFCIYTMPGDDFAMSITGPCKGCNMSRGIVFNLEEILNLLNNT